MAVRRPFFLFFVGFVFVFLFAFVFSFTARKLENGALRSAKETLQLKTTARKKPFVRCITRPPGASGQTHANTVWQVNKR